MTNALEPQTVSPLDFDERKSILDSLHLLLLLVTAGVLAALWFLRLLEINVAVLALAIAATVLLQSVCSSLLRRSVDSPSREAYLALLHLIAIPVLLYTWQEIGSVEVPLFLAAFAVPVATASLVRVRGHGFTTALLSLSGVVLVAVLADSELRWFVDQRGLHLGWLGPTSAPAAGGQRIDVHPAFHVRGLALFGAFLFALALASDTVLATIVRTRDRFRASRRALSESEAVFQSAVFEASTPTAIVYADSLQVLHASRSFANRLFLDAGGVAGQRLLDLVEFKDKNQLSDWLRVSRGRPRGVTYQLGPELRIAEVNAVAFRVGGANYLRVELRDFGDSRYLESGVRAGRDAVLVIDANARVRFENAAAERLFGKVEYQSDASELIERAGLPLRPSRGDEEGAVEFVGEVAGRRFRIHVENFIVLGGERATYLALRSLDEGDARRDPSRTTSVLSLYSGRGFNEKLVRLRLPSSLRDALVQPVLGLLAFARGGEWVEPQETELLEVLAALERELPADASVGLLRRGRVSVLCGDSGEEAVLSTLEKARETWHSSRLSDEKGATDGPMDLIVAAVSLQREMDLDQITHRAEETLSSALDVRKQRAGALA